MQIRNHRLHEDDGTPVSFLASPHCGDGLEPVYLVIHSTATLSLDSALNWFRDPAARASAHVIIDRDGGTVQMVPFDRCAWHAGRSRWEEREDLNAYSVGVELVNAGPLHRARILTWADWAGHRVPRRETLVARHKHQSSDRRWHAFTPIQIARALAVGKALHARYGFRAVLGHDDIAPDRKLDPGPAFPMTRFAAEVLGTTEVA